MGHDDDPPSDRAGARTTGRHRAIANGDADWDTYRRALSAAERARREDAKHRGHLEARIAQLVHDVGATEKIADALTSQVAHHSHRLAELEADVKKFDANNDFVVGANAVLATLKWAIPVLLAACSALASGITYLLVHK